MLKNRVKIGGILMMIGLLDTPGWSAVTANAVPAVPGDPAQAREAATVTEAVAAPPTAMDPETVQATMAQSPPTAPAMV